MQLAPRYGMTAAELGATANDLAARNHSLLADGDDLGMAGLASTFNAETLRRVEVSPIRPMRQILPASGPSPTAAQAALGGRVVRHDLRGALAASRSRPCRRRFRRRVELGDGARGCITAAQGERPHRVPAARQDDAGRAVHRTVLRLWPERAEQTYHPWHYRLRQPEHGRSARWSAQ